MEKILALIRHSAVQIDQSKPSASWDLSPEGEIRSRAFARQIEHLRLDRIITSSEPKAIKTGQLIAEVLGLPVETAVGIEEHHRTKTNIFENRDEFITAVEALFGEPDSLVFGEESANEALNRFAKSVGEILMPHSSKNLGLVTHGTVLSLFIAHYNPQLDAKGIWHTLKMPCAAIVSIPDFSLKEIILPEFF